MVSTNPFRLHQDPPTNPPEHYLTSNPNNPFTHPADLDEDAAIAWQLQYDMENDQPRSAPSQAPSDDTINDLLIAESLQEQLTHEPANPQIEEDIEKDRMLAERLQHELSDNLGGPPPSPPRPDLSQVTADANLESDRKLAERLQREFSAESSAESSTLSPASAAPSNSFSNLLDEEEPPAYSPYVSSGEQVLEQGPNRPYQAATSSSYVPQSSSSYPPPQMPPPPASPSFFPPPLTTYDAPRPGGYSVPMQRPGLTPSQSPERPCPQCGNIGSSSTSTLLGFRVPGPGNCSTCWRTFGTGVTSNLRTNIANKKSLSTSSASKSRKRSNLCSTCGGSGGSVVRVCPRCFGTGII